jgi:diguanylate cyclase (GGDEF)-like protein
MEDAASAVRVRSSPTAEDVVGASPETGPVSGAAATVGAPRPTTAHRDDWWSAAVLGGGFLAVVVSGLAKSLSSASASNLVTVALLACAHAVASRVVFEATGGRAVATEPVLVAALLLLSANLVPVVVFVGLLCIPRPASSRTRTHALLLATSSGWHCVGPIVVLGLAGQRAPSLRHWPVYAGALFAQFAFDWIVAASRCRALGLSWRVLTGPMAYMCGIDLLLAPIGLCAVLAANGSNWAVPLSMLPVGLLALLSRDRAENYEKAVVISEAYDRAVETSLTDELTEIGNRRAWNEAVERAALDFAANPAFVVGVIIADLDGLKAVNDRFGHEAGDGLIRAAATAFRTAAPPNALVARLGGDEFGMLITGSSVDTDRIVEELRASSGATELLFGTPLSMSIGAASCPPIENVEQASALADERARTDKLARRAGRLV